MTSVRIVVDVAGILTAIVSLVVSLAALQRVRSLRRAVNELVRTVERRAKPL